MEKRYFIHTDNETKSNYIKKLTDIGFCINQTYPCGNIYYTVINEYPLIQSHKSGLRFRTYYYYPNSRKIILQNLAGRYEFKNSQDSKKKIFELSYSPKIEIDSIEYIQSGMVFYDRLRLKKGDTEITIDSNIKTYICLFNNDYTPILAEDFSMNIIIEIKNHDETHEYENIISEYFKPNKSFINKFDLVNRFYNSHFLDIVNHKNLLAKINLTRNEIEKKINYYNCHWNFVGELIENAFKNENQDFNNAYLKTKEYFFTRNHFVIEKENNEVTYMQLSDSLFMKKQKSLCLMSGDGTLSRSEKLSNLRYNDFETLLKTEYSDNNQYKYLGYADRTKVNLFLESNNSGNIYGISIDSTISQNGSKLNQIEIEYNNTLANFSLKIAEQTLLNEIQEIGQYIKRTLYIAGIKFDENPVVKFEWIKKINNYK